MKKLNIKLRDWEIEDAPALAAAVNNKKVLDNLRDGIPFPYTEKDAEEFIHATLSAEKDSQYAFAITCDDQVIGSIGVFRKENIHRFTAELGYYIAEPYWGKGVMTKAVRQIGAYVFENTNIVRIFAEPYAFNAASCRVLEKAGFQFEGILRQNAVKNGRIRDMKMYALIRPKSGESYLIRRLNADDIVLAMELVGCVFSEFEAPEYSDEGIAEFKAFIEAEQIKARVTNGEYYLWGAFDGIKIIGVIATRLPLHISLLFVDKQYHRQGIARKLFETVINDKPIAAGQPYVTVHSSPYAIEIYRRLGFAQTDTEQTVNGLRFIPMKFEMDL